MARTGLGRGRRDIRVGSERKHPQDRHLQSESRIRNQRKIPPPSQRDLVVELHVLGGEPSREPRTGFGEIGIGIGVGRVRHGLPNRDSMQDRAMSRLSALKMIKRRARKVGLPAEICAHSFRGTGITEYLRNGGDLEVAARIAGHESTRTTQLYNRLPEEISLDEIERIHI